MNSLVELENISKNYGHIQALHDVTFDIRKGEVHALLGENGAGKSTCMRIIRGEIAPSQGKVLVDGQQVKHFNPSVGDQLGIAMVHQELAVFNGLSVAENIFPSFSFRSTLGFVNRKEMIEAAQKKLSVFNLSVDPEAIMSTLTPGQKQIIEILRATSDDRRLIILDEPTSSLNLEETETLLKLIKQLRDTGRSVLFVSHRIPEVLEICDRITVLRDGTFIETLENENLTENDLITRMAGREVDELYTGREIKDYSEKPVIMNVKDLSAEQGVGQVSFELREGEVVGFFGLEGSGTAQLSQLLFGLEKKSDGGVFLSGDKMEPITPRRMIQSGVTYLNPDRSYAGLYRSRPMVDSITAPILDRIQSHSLIDNKAAKNIAEEFKARFSIKAPNIAASPASLSGGNQQKVMMTACLAPEPNIVIVNDPTRGVDVGAKVEMHGKLLELADAGTGVLIFSSELPELIGLCDRVFTMRSNRIVGELSADQMTEEAIMSLAAGGVALSEQLNNATRK